MDDRLERAWAAGFFDGEGWAAAQGQRGRRTKQPMAQINQADPNGVPEVLERFRRAVGCGQIYGPKRKPGRIDLYSWVASSRPNVERTWDAIAPWLGSVKRDQFANALSLGSPRPTQDRGDHGIELAWAAGLFDGEGSTCLLDHGSHAGYFVGEMSVTQASQVSVPEVLIRFRAALQRGNVTGPVMYRDCPTYRWKTYSLDDIGSCFHLLGPKLGRVKRAQALAVLKTLAQQPQLPRGNPAWGNRKTHCVKGHEYATARLQPFRPRQSGTERRASKQCLRCVREYAQRKRMEKKHDGSSEPPRIGEPKLRYLLK